MVEKNTTDKNKLKKYRGILFSECVDVIDEHDRVEVEHHQIGREQDVCSLCKEYIQLQSEIGKVEKLIKKAPLLDDETKKSAENKRQRYYFLCQYLNQSAFVVRAQNRIEAQSIIRDDSDQQIKSVEKINRNRAFQLIELFDGASSRKKINFLKHNANFEGIVSKIISA